MEVLGLKISISEEDSVRIRDLLQGDLCSYELHEQIFYNTGGNFCVEKITETGGSSYQCHGIKIKESSEFFTQETHDVQKLDKDGYVMLQKNLEKISGKKIKKSCVKFLVSHKDMNFCIFIEDVSNLGSYLRISVPFYNRGKNLTISQASIGITDLMKKIGFEKWFNSSQSYADLMINKEGLTQKK
jgi:hypothetical protein